MESTQFTTQEIVSTETISSPLSDFQKAALADAEKNLEALRKEISETKYLVDLSKQDIKVLGNFINTDAPWKFTESLGIIEIEKEMKKAEKEGKLFISDVAVEAIYYYLSKVEGKGKNTSCSAFEGGLEQYIKILRSISEVLEKVKANNNRLSEAEFVVSARREGIEPDASLTQK